MGKGPLLFGVHVFFGYFEPVGSFVNIVKTALNLFLSSYYEGTLPLPLPVINDTSTTNSILL